MGRAVLSGDMRTSLSLDVMVWGLISVSSVTSALSLRKLFIIQSCMSCVQARPEGGVGL